MEEPYYLPIEAIGKLTDAQIVGMYARERDKDGRPKPVGADRARKYSTPEESKQAFFNIMSAFGKTPNEIEAAWNKSRGG